MKNSLFEEELIDGESVWEHIIDITPDEDDVPHGFYDLIKNRMFKYVGDFDVSILLRTDPDFLDYYENSEDRYDHDEVSSDELYNPIVVVDDELLDGYSRSSFVLRYGDGILPAYVSVDGVLSEGKGLIMEYTPVKSVKDINLWGLIAAGRSNLSKQVTIPMEFLSLFNTLTSSISQNKDQWVLDVTKGSLSSSTLDNMVNNIINSLKKIVSQPLYKQALTKIPKTEMTLLNTIVGRTILKRKINNIVSDFGKSYFIDGVVSQIRKSYDPNSPIVKKYVNVMTQLGNNVGNNQKLKDSIQNIIINSLP